MSRSMPMPKAFLQGFRASFVHAPWVLFKWLINVAISALCLLPIYQLLRRDLEHGVVQVREEGGLSFAYFVDFLFAYSRELSILDLAWMTLLGLFALGNLVTTAGFLSALERGRQAPFGDVLAAGVFRAIPLGLLAAIIGSVLFYGYPFIASAFPWIDWSYADGPWQYGFGLGLALLGICLASLIYDYARIFLFRTWTFEQDIPDPVRPLWWLVKPLFALTHAFVFIATHPLKAPALWSIFALLSAALVMASQRLLDTGIGWGIVQVLILARIATSTSALGAQRALTLPVADAAPEAAPTKEATTAQPAESAAAGDPLTE